MQRRSFLRWIARASVGLAAGGALITARGASAAAGAEGDGATLSLFLAGDVMTGRGIDQVLPHSVDPELREPYVRDARRYVELAEEANGAIGAPLTFDEPWGDALAALDREDPDLRIVNLETSVTTADDFWPGKGIHYRMHPGNVSVLTAAGIDVCTLGNNHVMDFGRSGLEETLATLRGAGVATPGAGADLDRATAPAVAETPRGRVLVFSYGMPSAGVPASWRAGEDTPGVATLPAPTPERADDLARHVHAHRRDGDRVVVSLHWGPNWGYEIPEAQRSFAHRLIDAEAADVVHGHSSHHPKGIEVHRGRPILYGAGDFLNDYEGIGGHEQYRPELVVAYLPRLDDAGALVSFHALPFRIRRFRLERAEEDQVAWLADRLDRESRPFGVRVQRVGDGRLELDWE